MRKPATKPLSMFAAVGSILLGAFVGQSLLPTDLGQRLASECAETLVKPFHLFEIDGARQRNRQEDTRAGRG